MLTDELRDWLVAFVFTQLVEIPIYMRGLSCGVVQAFGASALTHPLVWFLFPLVPASYLTQVVAAELFAWLGEAAYLRALQGPPWRHPLLWALLANAASLSLGLVSRWLFGVP